jgi:protein-tyrosine phosphatase
MIDLHSHFLPGIDDGAGDLDTSLEMIRQAVDSGITRLLATPHINEHTTPEKEQQIRETFEMIRSEVCSAGIPLELSLSAEIRFDPALFNWMGHDWLLIGEGKKYVIFELPIQGLPLNITDHLFNLKLKGVTPIIAHPERNLVFQNQKEKLFTQIDPDTVIQVNAGSITGQFGPGARQLAFALLRERKAHLVCSDAHETKHRTYRVLRLAYEELQRTFGPETADLLCTVNPQRILEGGDLSVLPVESRKKGFRSLLDKVLRSGN